MFGFQTLTWTDTTFMQIFAQSVWDLAWFSFHERRRHLRNFLFFSLSPNSRPHVSRCCLIILSWWPNDSTINGNISIWSVNMLWTIYLSCPISWNSCLTLKFLSKNYYISAKTSKLWKMSVCITKMLLKYRDSLVILQCIYH